ncbi:MAG: SurA N-terminal domain-containing protein [Elusimicrobiota bacterium]|jgi:hypothetical protein|nr:SurA N-terminal domain-containing protein [Elusimicrobiota bacterium]
MRKILFVFFVSLFLLINYSNRVFADVFLPFFSEKVVAVVNGKKILSNDYYFNVALRSQVNLGKKSSYPIRSREAIVEGKIDYLNYYIDRMLILQAAKKQKIKPNNKEVAATIKKMISEGGKDFDRYRRSRAIDNNALERLVREGFIINAFEEKLAEDNNISAPTRERIREVYNEIQAKNRGEKLDVSQQEDNLITQLINELNDALGPKIELKIISLYVPTGDNAEYQKRFDDKIVQIKEALKTRDFGDVAEEYSENMTSKMGKGDASSMFGRNISQTKYEEVDKAIAKLKVGQYTPDPIQIETPSNKYAVFIKLEKKMRGIPIQNIPFDKLSNLLANAIYAYDMKIVLDEWLAKEKEKSKIVIYYSPSLDKYIF